ncbi:response regulator [Puniceicoccaceae bacterium K14]|nr:response regulator [Puniceicoccaceae bacterium K14]
MLGYIIFDTTGQINFVSKGTERRLGFEPGSLCSENIQDLFDEKHLPNFLKEGIVWGRVNGVDPSLGPVEVNIQNLESNDEAGRGLQLASISRFNGDSILAKSSKSGKVTGLSEFRFLFKEQSRFSKELYDHTPEGVVQEGIAFISELGETACEIINDLDIGNEPEEFNAKSTNIAVLIESVFGLYEPYFTSKKIEYTYEVEVLDEVVGMCGARVSRALAALLATALSGREIGKIIIKATSDEVDDSEAISFTLSFEEGSGARELNTLSKDYKYFDTRKTIGSSLVDSLGGSLRFRPDEGNNFSFIVGVPVEKTKEEIEERNQSMKRILVVEDNQLNIDILTHFLRDYGSPYDVVKNGKLAVDMYEDGKYDLILMDIMLPVMNGYEATEKILEKGKNVPPIIGVTAKVFRDDKDLCLECGMLEVINKPIDFTRLKKSLDKVFGGEEAKVEKTESVSNDSSVEKMFDWRTAENYLGRMESAENSRKDLIDRYLAEIRLLLDQIKLAALQDSGFEEIQRHAHSLKGNLGLVGANNMQDLALGLEMTARKSNVHFKPEHWLNLLTAAFVDLERSMRSLA